MKYDQRVKLWAHMAGVYTPDIAWLGGAPEGFFATEEFTFLPREGELVNLEYTFWDGVAYRLTGTVAQVQHHPQRPWPDAKVEIFLKHATLYKLS